MKETERLYWADSYQSTFDAEVLEIAGNDCLLSATAFYPGGGGQPSDTGVVVVAGQECRVVRASLVDSGLVWHHLEAPLPGRGAAQGRIDWPRRYRLMQHHTLLHILNTLVFRAYAGLITGVQIGESESRIDFALEGFDRGQLPILERLANEVILKDHDIGARLIPEAEFRATPDLTRTLTVAPPVHNGVARVMRIADFDEQACGGTHVHRTGELGVCAITKFDNKGRRNKRMYVRLNPLPAAR